jgi:hypothetical protein
VLHNNLRNYSDPELYTSASKFGQYGRHSPVGRQSDANAFQLAFGTRPVEMSKESQRHGWFRRSHFRLLGPQGFLDRNLTAESSLRPGTYHPASQEKGHRGVSRNPSISDVEQGTDQRFTAGPTGLLSMRLQSVAEIQGRNADSLHSRELRSAVEKAETNEATHGTTRTSTSGLRDEYSQALESGFETNSGGLRRAAGLYIPAQSGICNSGDSGHEPKGASEKLALGIPVRNLPSAEGSYGGTAQSCDLGSLNRDADSSVASNAPACSDFGDGFLSESTNEDQSLWCTFIESNPQLIEEEDHIPLFVEVLGRHGPIIQRQFKTQSESI